MPKPKGLLIFLIFCFLLASVSYAADINYPYGNIYLKLPPSEDPFPGLGNYYSTLSKGMKSALWNPASLGKLKLSESSISMTSALEKYVNQSTFNLNEMSGTMEAGEYALFFRSPQNISSGISTREVEVQAQANYATSGSGTNFSSALKINDWLTIGFASNSPVITDINLAGDFPTTARLDANLYGGTMGDMEIASDGKLQYTFTSGGIVTTYESVSSLWTGFLSQEVTIPLTTLSELRNDMNVQSPFIGTIATKFGNFCLGLNMIPIAATANIDNDLRVVINSDTEDQFFYTPDFDPKNQTELTNWINDPDNYSTIDGYRRKTIRVPAGQIIATTKYRGFYTASATRLDIGAQFEATDWLTVGMALENYGGSSLNFKGNGIATYINHRDLNTAEAGSYEDLLQPGGKTSIDIISDKWVTTTESGGTALYLEPEKNYDLPKRMRYGVAFKRPFLIAIDLEQNYTSIKYVTTKNDQPKEINISNINLLRIGGETQLARLPVWLRGGFTFLFKPTITGLSTEEEDAVNNAYKYGVLPLRVDLGMDADMWGTIMGTSLGVNAQNLINALQLDTFNMDISKLVHVNTYVARDAWEVSYLLNLEPYSAAKYYSSKEISDLKFVQTLGVTYRF